MVIGFYRIFLTDNPLGVASFDFRDYLRLLMLLSLFGFERSDLLERALITEEPTLSLLRDEGTC